MKISPSSLHRVTAAWDLDYILQTTSTDLSWSEYLIHELCHAAVFGFRFFHVVRLGRSKNLSGAIQDQFSRYLPFASPSDDFRMERWSDLSECRALAAEQHVLEQLRWLSPIRKIVLYSHDSAKYYRHTRNQICWPDIVHDAADNMRVLKPADAHRYVARFYPQQANRQRAKLVISWLEKLVGSRG